MASRSPRSGIGAARRRPELPAFCRTRRRHPVVVEISRLRGLQAQLWLVLLIQLSTLLLVLAGPVPQRPGAGHGESLGLTTAEHAVPPSARSAEQTPWRQRHPGRW